KESRKFIESVWKQCAQAFNNSYDEHLIFETFNEPVDMLHEHNFWERTDCATCKKDFAILNEYNQLIVDTIRSTGGNNANRFILIEGLGARWQNISNNLFKMPKDKAKNKLIPTFHYYPMGGSEEYSNKYYIDAIKDQIPEAFAALDKKYFSKHIPVYLGETGQSRHTPIMERINMMKDIMAEVTKPGRSCNASLWNDSDFSGISPWFSGYFDNWKLKWYDEEFVNTFLYGAQGKEYPLSADFIKRNEVKIESLVGKNILSEPLDLTDFGEDYRLAINLFYHSTPAKYKLVFDVEKKSSDSILRLAYQDLDSNWHEIAPMKGVKIKGGTLKDGWCISVKDNTVELSIDETLASELSGYAQYIFLNGKNIIIKSVKVVE
ncbi:MAG: cellulase family glycosylhydrolase, partial [Treponema sp.]|nr:cellulase family glycosylhydrolase [Treponema sp.]